MTWGTFLAGVVGGAVGTAGTLVLIAALAVAGKRWLTRRRRAG